MILERAITIRIVLSIAVSFGWYIKQVDVNNVFLHGFLNETNYMSQLVDFTHPQQPNVVSSKESIVWSQTSTLCLLGSLD